MGNTATLRSVNSKLAAAGYAERLAKGDGYFYFYGGRTGFWPLASVYVYRISALTVGGWLDEFHRLRSDSYDENDAADSRSVMEVARG